MSEFARLLEQRGSQAIPAADIETALAKDMAELQRLRDEARQRAETCAEEYTHHIRRAATAIGITLEGREG